MRKVSYFLLFLTLIITLNIPVLYATQENVYQEGQVYQDPDDGKYYKIIDGKPYEVDTGSSGEGSIADAFMNYSSTTTPDTDVINSLNENVVSPIGTVISFIIYIIFAMTAFTTVCDLLWITVPPLRSFLNNGVVTDSIGSANANLLGRNTAWTALAQNSANKANQHNMQSQVYAQQAQNLAAMGDRAGAQRAMYRANSEARMAQNNANWANHHMQEQAKSDAWRAQANQRTMESAQKRAENNQN